MRSFYHFVITFRGKVKSDSESRFADWVFKDHSFPRQSTDYHEISSYIEVYSPSPDGVQTFDQLWKKYEENEMI
ncbi:YozE family protein [Bacillaceae bacterium S4-13-58]